MNGYDNKPFLYVKAPGDKRFAPVDWRNGVSVNKRFYASMFKREEKPLVEKDMSHPKNAHLKWEWRK